MPRRTERAGAGTDIGNIGIGPGAVSATGAVACSGCGACCATYRVDFHCSELASRQAGGVPDALTVPLTATLVRMAGTDAAPPRCVALAGAVGASARCTIYACRPPPCREFAPLAAIGIGDEACTRARRRFGLPALAGLQAASQIQSQGEGR